MFIAHNASAIRDLRRFTRWRPICLAALLSMSAFAAPSVHDVGIYADAVSWVDSTAPNKNYGSSPYFQVRFGSPSGIRRFGYIRWNLDGIPADAIIQEVTVQLQPVFRAKTYTTATITAKPVCSEWTEGDGRAEGTEVSSSDNVLSWVSQPKIKHRETVAETVYPDTDDIRNPLILSGKKLTALVQGWVDGSVENYGLQIGTSGIRYVGFASDDEQLENARPLLRIKLLSEEDPVLQPEVAATDDVVIGGHVGDAGYRVDKTYDIQVPAADVFLDLSQATAPFPTHILGVCLVPHMDREFAPRGINTFTDLFQGTSTRLWCQGRSLSGEYFTPLVKAVYPGTYFSFFPWNRLIAKGLFQAEYRSEEDNNLPDRVQPAENARHALEEYAALETLLHTNNFSMYYEVYNEPQFPPKGNWRPADFARYVNDVTRQIKKANPNIKTAVPLHLRDNEWNESLLSMLDSERVDCIVNHNYGFAWIHISQRENQDYFARVGEVKRQQRRFREDMALIDKYGRGRWKYAITEWNIHPHGYTSTNMVSTDIAAALYQAAMIGIMAEEGVDYAQVFQLISKDGAPHFGLVNNCDADLDTGRQAPFYVYQFIRDYLVGGKMIPVDVQVETFSWDMYDQPGKWEAETLEVPWVYAMASRKDDHIGMVIVNLSPETVEVAVRMSEGTVTGQITGQALDDPARSGVLKSIEHTVFDIEYDSARVLMEDGSLKIPVHPRSLTALSLPLS